METTFCERLKGVWKLAPHCLPVRLTGYVMLHKKSPAQTELGGKSEKPPSTHLTYIAAMTATSIDIRLKVVPGSRKNEIVGPHGDRLKIKVAAPPEGGKANAAVCQLLAETLELSARDVTIIAGTSSAEKVARVERGSRDTTLLSTLASRLRSQ
jgi:uncharacterized protein